MGRWGDGEMGRWGDGEMGSVGQEARGKRQEFINYSAVPCSRFPIPDSRFPIPDSRFPVPDSRFPTPYSLLPTPYSLAVKIHKADPSYLHGYSANNRTTNYNRAVANNPHPNSTKSRFCLY